MTCMMGFAEPVGLKEFEADRILAEGRRQTAIAEAIANPTSNTGEKVKAADREYYRAVVASARANGIQHGDFLRKLVELGG